MTQRERATTRISAGFAGFINGLSENENAAMRALMLLGADQIGIDLTLVADDLRLTIGARLPPAIYDRLLAMLSRVPHDAVGSSRTEEARAFLRRAPACLSSPATANEHLEQAVILQAPDPFGSIGFDFDEAAE
jgi:hypothetical protein